MSPKGAPERYFRSGPPFYFEKSGEKLCNVNKKVFLKTKMLNRFSKTIIIINRGIVFIKSIYGGCREKEGMLWKH